MIMEELKPTLSYPNPDRKLDLAFACVHVLPWMLISSWRPVVQRVYTSSQAVVRFEYPKGEVLYLQFQKQDDLVLEQGFIDWVVGSELSQSLEDRLRELGGLIDQTIVGHMMAGVIYGKMRLNLVSPQGRPISESPVKLLDMVGPRSGLAQVLSIIFTDERVADGDDVYQLLRPTIDGLRLRKQE